MSYVERGFENGNRNRNNIDQRNVRSRVDKTYSVGDNVKAENERTAGKNDKISNKISRYNDGSSSTSTYAQNTGIKELDNSFFSFDERYDGLKNL